MVGGGGLFCEGGEPFLDLTHVLLHRAPDGAPQRDLAGHDVEPADVLDVPDGDGDRVEGGDLPVQLPDADDDGAPAAGIGSTPIHGVEPCTCCPVSTILIMQEAPN